MSRLASPYLPIDSDSRWLKGNHHGHSTVSDGLNTPEENIRLYEDAGYDYLALSEHDTLLDVRPLQAGTGMCLIPAIEVTSCFGQTLLYLGADREFPAKAWTPSQIMSAVHDAGGLFVYDHPNWLPVPDYTTDDLLDTMDGLAGMEIYTGVIERLPGNARATNRWDRLLSKGWHVFGHGTDDQHELKDCFIAWNCVQWEPDRNVTWQGIVEACRSGRFYASTGVTVSCIGTDAEGSSATVVSDADEVHWIADGGVIVRKAAGGTDSISMDALLETVPEDQLTYLRAECLGQGNRTAWCQPFFLTSGDGN